LPHFTLQIGPNGPIVNALLGVSRARRDALVGAGQTAPQPQRITALIDTGASCTTVDPSVVTALNLQPTGIASVLTPTTGTVPHQTNQYDVLVAIAGPGPTLALTEALIFQTIAVIEAPLLQAQGFHALIGRDILNRCLLVYNGSMGFFTLGY
jgi:predicted aspartyl protease